MRRCDAYTKRLWKARTASGSRAMGCRSPTDMQPALPYGAKRCTIKRNSPCSIDVASMSYSRRMISMPLNDVSSTASSLLRERVRRWRHGRCGIVAAVVLS